MAIQRNCQMEDSWLLTSPPGGDDPIFGPVKRTTNETGSTCVLDLAGQSRSKVDGIAWLAYISSGACRDASLMIDDWQMIREMDFGVTIEEVVQYPICGLSLCYPNPQVIKTSPLGAMFSS